MDNVNFGMPYRSFVFFIDDTLFKSYLGWALIYQSLKPRF